MFWQVLSQPGVRSVYAATMIGRLPMGAIGLLFVLVVQQQTGSYAAGGIVAAAEAIGAALVAPALGRAVDKVGQARILIPTGFLCGIALAVFALLPDGAPVVVFVAVAAVAGMSLPPLSACQRALWSAAVEPRLRHAAFTLDSVVFELIFIAGPLLLVGGIGAWSLQAAVGVCAVATLIGTLLFTVTALSRSWQPTAVPGRDWMGAIRGRGVRTVLVAFLLFGIGISPTEVGVAAFARENGAGGAIGVLLALWAFGSMLGGIVAGNLPAPRDPARRLGELLLCLGVLQVPLALAGGPIALGAALVAAGAMLAPALSLSFSLLSTVAPTGTETEAQTWATTAIGGGIALGAALGGSLIEHVGTSAALAIPPVVGVVAALVVLSRLATLRVAAA